MVPRLRLRLGRFTGVQWAGADLRRDLADRPVTAGSEAGTRDEGAGPAAGSDAPPAADGSAHGEA
ncbi:hypothetical protein ACIRPP_26400 [Streptomyces sp. NPDC101219]|uniref:hypothetical protein n=1 Tax=Streptomyces sp. NPDC101219 TaxID=3366131 RepID=UPI003824ACBC